MNDENVIVNADENAGPIGERRNEDDRRRVRESLGINVNTVAANHA
jgi:hypothetical protein